MLVRLAPDRRERFTRDFNLYFFIEQKKGDKDEKKVEAHRRESDFSDIVSHGLHSRIGINRIPGFQFFIFFEDDCF